MWVLLEQPVLDAPVLQYPRPGHLGGQLFDDGHDHGVAEAPVRPRVGDGYLEAVVEAHEPGALPRGEPPGVGVPLFDQNLGAVFVVARRERPGPPAPLVEAEAEAVALLPVFFGVPLQARPEAGREGVFGIDLFFQDVVEHEVFSFDPGKLEGVFVVERPHDVDPLPVLGHQQAAVDGLFGDGISQIVLEGLHDDPERVAFVVGPEVFDVL